MEEKMQIFFNSFEYYIKIYDEDAIKNNVEQFLNELSYGETPILQCFKELEKEEQQRIVNYIRSIYFRDVMLNDLIVRELFRTVNLTSMSGVVELYGVLQTSSEGKNNRTIARAFANWEKCQRIMTFFSCLILLNVGRNSLRGTQLSTIFTVVMIVIATYSLLSKNGVQRNE